jgi:hypothetical protein
MKRPSRTTSKTTYPWHFHKEDTFNGKVPKLRSFLKKTWRWESTNSSGRRSCGVKARVLLKLSASSIP